MVAPPLPRALDAIGRRGVERQTFGSDRLVAIEAPAIVADLDPLERGLDPLQLGIAAAGGGERHLLALQRIHAGEAAHLGLVELHGGAVLGSCVLERAQFLLPGEERGFHLAEVDAVGRVRHGVSIDPAAHLRQTVRREGGAVKIDVVQDVRAALGESPVWDAGAGRLHWMDLAARRYWRLDPATGIAEAHDLPAEPGSLALSRAGDLVAAFEDGFWRLDPETGARTPIADPEVDLPGNRFNDGKAGPDDAFWAGSLSRDYKQASGTLWRLAADGAVTAAFDSIYVSNGPAWSPAGDRFYFSDSVRGVTWSFPFDPATGALGERTVFAARDAAPGYPDGAATDADGCLWSARWTGGCLARFTPDGRVDRLVEMPVSRVTSCAFGGPDLGTLFVTSASIGLGAEELAEAPLSGAVFALNPSVQGAPVGVFAG